MQMILQLLQADESIIAHQTSILDTTVTATSLKKALIEEANKMLLEPANTNALIFVATEVGAKHSYTFLRKGEFAWFFIEIPNPAEAMKKAKYLAKEVGYKQKQPQ